MKHLIATVCALTLCGSALASPSCQKPKDTWMPMDAFKARLVEQGYTVKRLKVTRGQCYEMYGFDKAGRKVELYFDPATAAVLASE